MTSFITLPGIGGSGETHWQSHWEAADPCFARFRPSDWDKPVLADWRLALERQIDSARSPPVLVAHSLACLLVAHAAEQIAGRISGAFLVAVPDPGSAAFPAAAAGFANPPRRPLPFPALIIASANDPYAAPDHVRTRAKEWKAGLVEVGACGHINGASGLGAWAQGRMLMDAFCAGLRC
ncbi:RBBP9/YdeN family alpha/beta hydrolase [Martelella soudanensis]|uniref:RBBP9/YdeN family alpha/beta hydrolase n=1 Tax=unclassified Martelella TaxID=2629616 RepID=UPI0015DD79BC|nr:MULTISPECIES: alpha/beta fold hydrolase [unclassified Martelella]